MTKDNLNCKTGLAKNIINQEIFDREISLCQKLTKKKVAGVAGANVLIVVLSRFYINCIKVNCWRIMKQR